MNRTFRAVLLALFLTAIGLSIFFNKLVTSNIPLLPNQSYQSWYVEAKVTIDSARSLLESDKKLPSTIRLQLPQESDSYTIFQEDFISNGFTRQFQSPENDSNRIVMFENQGGDTGNVLFYRAIIDQVPWSGIFSFGQDHVSPSSRRVINQGYNDSGQGQVVADNLEENLPATEIQDLLAQARQNADNRLQLAKNLYQIVLQENDIRVQAIRDTLAGSKLSATELTAFLLKRGQIPARIGNGISLTQKETYTTDFIHWLEVYDGEQWLAYDPITNSFQPQNRYLSWWYGNTPALSVQGSGTVNLEVVVRPNTDSGLTQSIWQDRAQSSLLLNYSLLRLPLTSQRVFQILVLIPIGALIISVIHQMIGIQTFGTFTPILIALAFRETGVLVGIPLFILIVILGLFIRAYLNHLQLLIVPRLAAILTATVLLMGVIAIIMDRLQIDLGLSISLFPIVILAMTIERAALMWEEQGGREVAIAGSGTLIVALIGYLWMINDYVQHLVFAFPELLFPVLGVNLLVGRYNGYKLIEYLRFRSMIQQLEYSAKQQKP